VTPLPMHGRRGSHKRTNSHVGRGGIPRCVRNDDRADLTVDFGRWETRVEVAIQEKGEEKFVYAHLSIELPSTALSARAATL
jgi:hypothetical protein